MPKKIRRKILRVGRLSDVEGQPTAPQSRGDSLLKQENRPDLDEMGGCMELPAVWPVTTLPSQKSGSIVRKPESLFIPFKYHPQSIPESNQVSLLHECQLVFLWNVLPGLDESVHRSQPGDTASKNHT